MTTTSTYGRFTIRHLDCAICADKLEKELEKIPGAKKVIVDFANMKLYVDADDVKKVLEAASRIEPDIEFVDESVVKEQIRPGDQPWLRRFGRELAVMILALAVILCQLLYEDWIHHRLGLTAELLIVLTTYFLVGWKVLKSGWRTLQAGQFFDENILMLIATVGALSIHAYAEAIGVMLFFNIGELLQDLAVGKSRRSVQALLAARPDQALLKTEAGYQPVAPQAVNPGAIILVKPGEKIPLDGTVLTGNSELDTSALTGESMPVAAAPGQTVMAGQINRDAALTIRVTRPFEASSIARIMELVENATARKARTEKFITRIARYYTPFVVLSALLVALLPPLLGLGGFKTWIYRASVLLMISCPCALIVSIPLGYFGGIGRASREGILVKGANFLDVLATVKTVIFDKTGTLTEGRFVVSGVFPQNGFDRNQLLEFAAAAESQSTHPIAKSIVTALHGQQKDFTKSVHEHLNLPGQGVKAIYDGHTVLVGNAELMITNNIATPSDAPQGAGVHVAVDGGYAGYLSIHDKSRADAAPAIKRLRHLGVSQMVLLTGDAPPVAEAVCKELKLDRFYAGLLPEEKVHILEKIAAQSTPDQKTAYLGDGINGAPVIARADVGVAMGGLGSDAAIETADVVLMTDSPLKLADAVSIARQTRRIVWQNIFLAFGVKGLFFFLGIMGMASMWEAVFADMGTSLAAVFNTTRLVRVNKPLSS